MAPLPRTPSHTRKANRRASLLTVDTMVPPSPFRAEAATSSATQKMTSSLFSTREFKQEYETPEHDRGENGHLHIELSGLKDLDDLEDELTRVT